MRLNLSVKILIGTWLISLLLLWSNIYQKLLTELNDTAQLIEIEEARQNHVLLRRKSQKLKYILQWTNPNDVPFVYMGVGREGFIKNNCAYTNCYVTADRYYLEDYTQFDVIVFNGPEVIGMDTDRLPLERSDVQKFVFASIESSQIYPVCSHKFDGYFNWTWTFRLDSETRWGYMIIRDKNNKIIGPNKVMHWMKLDDMEPVSEDFKLSLKTKTKAAAWFVSNCFSISKREEFVSKLEEELAKYKLTVDIFGVCGYLSCPKNNSLQMCEDIIKTTYYFYLSFENSFSEDYVTEKLLYGLRNNAIPVVYGGANYTRFMPDGIYLNARQLGVVKLAYKMNELIRSFDKYAEYFKWKNHYAYYRRNENSETNDYCNMCALLNNEEMMNKKSVYKSFRKWWESPKRRCLEDFYKMGLT